MMPAKIMLTVEDALALPDRDDCRYELDEGELIEMPLPMPRHQRVVQFIGLEIGIYLRSRPVGQLFPSDTPFVLSREPAVLRGPDLAFVRKDSPLNIDPDKAIEGSPDLAVEVASPNDRTKSLLKKVWQHLDAGAAEVWLVIPDSASVHIYSQTESLRILRVGDELTSSLLPGFSFNVELLFA